MKKSAAKCEVTTSTPGYVYRFVFKLCIIKKLRSNLHYIYVDETSVHAYGFNQTNLEIFSDKMNQLRLLIARRCCWQNLTSS